MPFERLMQAAGDAAPDPGSGGGGGGPPGVTIDMSGLANAIWQSLLDHLGDIGNAIWTGLAPQLPNIGTEIWKDLSQWMYSLLRGLLITLWNADAAADPARHDRPVRPGAEHAARTWCGGRRWHHSGAGADRPTHHPARLSGSQPADGLPARPLHRVGRGAVDAAVDDRARHRPRAAAGALGGHWRRGGHSARGRGAQPHRACS